MTLAQLPDLRRSDEHPGPRAALFADPRDHRPTDAELLARFRPVLDRIADGALEREDTGRLPLEEAGWLRDAGLGALRVPVELGGSGASLRQLLLLLGELAAADSNLTQALRVHFRFGEDRWVEQDTERGRRWLTRLAEGAFVGNASSERTGGLRGPTGTTLRRVDGRLVLNGTKYYSTGSLYADWVSVAVADDERRVTALVPRNAAGLDVQDDYTGFGQRGSGSGTTVLTDVAVAEADVIETEQRAAGQWAVLQLTHLITLAGIARRAADEAAGFVRRRQRAYPQGSADVPREDPLVQRVLGRVDAAAHAARSIVLDVGGELDSVVDDRLALRRSGRDDPAAEAALARRELEVDVSVHRAQLVVIDLVLDAVNRIFEVGGSSAVDAGLHLDRHWRNARTIASHNPAIFREREIGEHLLRAGEPLVERAAPPHAVEA